MTQIPLFDAGAGQALAEEAIERVEAAADRHWKQAAYEAVEQVARTHWRFTTDHVWRELFLFHSDGYAREPRAMGAIMRRAMLDGICAKAPVLPAKSAMAL